MNKILKANVRNVGTRQSTPEVVITFIVKMGLKICMMMTQLITLNRMKIYMNVMNVKEPA